MRHEGVRATGTALLLLVLLPAGATGAEWTWTTLAPGLDLARIPVPEAEGEPIVILRADPRRWVLDILCKKDLDLSNGLTAKEFCDRYDLSAAINAGMFAEDYSTHVGYLKAGTHLNNGHVNAYQSVAVFGPVRDDLPPFRILDRDSESDWKNHTSGYTHVVQNLRLIKRPGENRWSRQDRRWSEAALGEDKKGRVLMIFSRRPYSMHDFNERLLSLDIDLVAAQHLEGGPEAQLYLKIGDGFHGFGSYETDFREDDSNARAWPVPNVIGLRPRGQVNGTN